MCKINNFGKYECPCCGFFTYDEDPCNTFQICPVCFWEDDLVQLKDPDYIGGANDISLNQARENFKKLGAMNESSLQYVRKPNIDEL